MSILLFSTHLKTMTLLKTTVSYVFPDATLEMANTLMAADHLIRQKPFDLICMDISSLKPLKTYQNQYYQWKEHLSTSAVLLLSDSIINPKAYFDINPILCYKFLSEPYSEQVLRYALFELKGMLAMRHSESYVFFQTKKAILKFQFSEILYAEINLKNVTIHTLNETFDIGRMTFIDLAHHLGESFVRVHRSFILNKYYMNILTKTTTGWYISIQENKYKIPVGSKYKATVLKHFEA